MAQWDKEARCVDQLHLIRMQNLISLQVEVSVYLVGGGEGGGHTDESQIITKQNLCALPIPSDVRKLITLSRWIPLGGTILYTLGLMCSKVKMITSLRNIKKLLPRKH